MSFTIISAEQRSPEWFAARLGRLTGSRADEMLMRNKDNSENYKRRDLRVQLVCERLTGVCQEDGFVSKDMQRGIDKEEDAFAAYEAATGTLVRRTGFLSHDSLMVGCSLDGDVDNFTGVIELKCPKSATHLEYLKSANVLPAKHVAQVTHNLWVSGAQWCDFASYDDRFPPELQLWIVRVKRDEKAIAAYELAVSLFLAEIDKEVEAVKALLPKVAA